MKINKQIGFTLIELLLSVSIFAILVGVITLNLNTAQRTANLSTTLEMLITDLNQQRIKAMVGDTEGRVSLTNYGIHADGVSYTLFNGTYTSTDSGNFLVNLPSTQRISTVFPNAQIVFTKGSGEVTCFIDLTCNNTSNTITLTDLTNNQQKVLTLNRYGVIIAVN
ncbi:MAG TPA: prepilin-type N-terminal cleavage/methylation domain-containing protein [Patescibacteria group bacterium]